MAHITSKEFTNLETGIDSGFVRTFPNRAAALSVASEFGWAGRVVRIARRFEVVWIVGAMDFQPDTAGTLEWDVLRVPALHYENGEQPVLKCRRLRRDAA